MNFFDKGTYNKLESMQLPCTTNPCNVRNTTSYKNNKNYGVLLTFNFSFTEMLQNVQNEYCLINIHIMILTKRLLIRQTVLSTYDEVGYGDVRIKEVFNTRGNSGYHEVRYNEFRI